MAMTEYEENIDIMMKTLTDGEDIRKFNRPKVSQNVMVHCPFHGRDKNPSCSINVYKGVYFCFACPEHGTLTSWYFKLTGSRYKSSNSRDSRTPSFIRKPHFVERKVDYSTPPNTHFETFGTSIKVNESEAGRKFVESRGFDPFVVSCMKFSYTTDFYTVDMEDPEKKKMFFSGRVLIPIYEKGKLISIEGRSLVKREGIKKSLYPKGSSVNTLYDFDNLDKHQTLYVLEGLMDLTFCRECYELKNSTTTFGCCITARQQYLLDQFDDVVFIINNDTSGIKGFVEVRDKLKKQPRVLLPPPKCNDANDIWKVLGKKASEMVEAGWLNHIQPGSVVSIPYQDSDDI